MADDGGEGLDVHPVFQGHGGKSMPEIMKSDGLAPGPLQNDLEALAHIAGIDGLVRLDPRREYQIRENSFFILCQHLQHSGRQDIPPYLGRADCRRPRPEPPGLCELPDETPG